MTGVCAGAGLRDGAERRADRTGHLCAVRNLTCEDGRKVADHWPFGPSAMCTKIQ